MMTNLLTSRRWRGSWTKALGSFVLFVLPLLACNTDNFRTTLRLARDRLVLAPVEVSGTEGWFLVDTGSEGTFVSPQLGSKLRPSSQRYRVSSLGRDDQSLEVSRVESGGIRFAGSRLKFPEEVSVLDLGFLADWAGSRVDGILGWDVLREYVSGIDVRGAVLLAGRSLSPHVVLRSLGGAGSDMALALEIVGDRPFVMARVGNQSLRLAVDTGADRTVLSAGAFERLGLQLPPDAATVTTRGVNGDASGQVARLPEIRVGPAVWAQPEVVVRSTANLGDEEGLLGMDLLSDYLIVIDGPSRTLYLSKQAPARR